MKPINNQHSITKSVNKENYDTSDRNISEKFKMIE